MKPVIDHQLAVRLKEGTKEAHRLAEGAAFFKDMFSGQVDRARYARMLMGLYAIYSALEEAMRSLQQHSVVGFLWDEALLRTNAIEADLDFYCDDAWRTRSHGKHALPDVIIQVLSTPAIGDYVRRIDELVLLNPELLVAHAYTRYLGDLSGGQLLKKVVRETLSLEGMGGLAFYHFPLIPDANAYKQEYRACLNVLPINESEADRIVAEAVHVFELNRAMLDVV